MNTINAIKTRFSVSPTILFLLFMRNTNDAAPIEKSSTSVSIACISRYFDTRDTMPDEKKKHVTSFGKGRKRRRLQLR